MHRMIGLWLDHRALGVEVTEPMVTNYLVQVIGRPALGCRIVTSIITKLNSHKSKSDKDRTDRICSKTKSITHHYKTTRLRIANHEACCNSHECQFMGGDTKLSPCPPQKLICCS